MSPSYSLAAERVSLSLAEHEFGSQSDNVPQQIAPPGKLTFTDTVPLNPQLLKEVREAAKTRSLKCMNFLRDIPLQELMRFPVGQICDDQ